MQSSEISTNQSVNQPRNNGVFWLEILKPCDLVFLTSGSGVSIRPLKYPDASRTILLHRENKKG